MRRLAIFLLAAALAGAAEPAGEDWWRRLKSSITEYLGRPYAWGSCGMKSFDCSGFVWRVFSDNGVLMKRTTARKLYLSLPTAEAGERWRFGNVVFFDDLKHCGIVADRTSFYHAASTKGTGLSRFDPYWRPKVCGVGKISP